MLVQAAFSEAFAAALAGCLKLDPNHARLLRPLAGKIIAVELLPFGQRFALSPTLDTVLVLSDFPGPADLTLRGSLPAFARLAFSSRPQLALFQGEIEVIGDVNVARRLQILLKRLDLDWEAWLADLGGSQLARGVADAIRAAAAWHRHAWQTFKWNLTEFLQEETCTLPPHLEAEDLYRRIDRLRDDVERLAARIKRLKARL